MKNICVFDIHMRFLHLGILFLLLGAKALTDAATVDSQSWDFVVTTHLDSIPQPRSCLSQQQLLITKDPTRSPIATCSLRSAWAACVEKLNNASSFTPVLSASTKQSKRSKRLCVIKFSSSLPSKQVMVSSSFNDHTNAHSALIFKPMGVTTATVASTNTKVPSTYQTISIQGSGQILQGDLQASRLIDWDTTGSDPQSVYQLSISNITIQKFGGFQTFSNLNTNGGCICMQGNAKTRNIELNMQFVTMRECSSESFYMTVIGVQHTGGALFVSQASTCTISNSVFSSNSADQGGSIYVRVSNNVLITDTNFTFSKAIGGGGAFFESCNSTLRDNVIASNIAQEDGGGAYFEKGNPTIISCHFVNNTAKEEFGGGTYFDKSNATIINSTVSQNLAKYNGGGSFFIKSNVTVLSCAFMRNLAVQKGGGVYSDSGNITIISTSIVNNIAQYEGGGAYCIKSKVILTSSSIENNAAEFDGGGAFFETSRIKVTASFMGKNIAQYGGGGHILWTVMPQLPPAPL